MEKSKYFLRIKPSKGWELINLKELWQYRDLIKILAMRDVQLRYKQTAIGVAWVILQPLMTSIIFTFIFGNLANLPSDEVNYTLFSFSGMLAWNIFAQALQRAGQSLVKDNQLITKIYFPRIIIPLASTLSVIIDFLVGSVVLFILLLIFGFSLTWNILALPFLLIICIFVAVGVGLWISSLSVFYRDFMYALPFIIQAWMYGSPVAYSLSLIPEKYEILYSLNPMVGMIQSFRWAFLGYDSFPLLSVGFSILVGGAIFILGVLAFKKMEKRFADVI